MIFRASEIKVKVDPDLLEDTKMFNSLSFEEKVEICREALDYWDLDSAYNVVSVGDAPIDMEMTMVGLEVDWELVNE